ncbi:MAG: hypothetical protein J6V09_04065 [Clostridia bacterium]|nr:hypothetical protein [Clostridia bacterium]
MKINEGRAAMRFALIALSVNLFSFLFYYLSTYVTDSTVLAYASLYFSEIASLLLPIACAAALTVTYVERGVNFSFLRALIYALTFIPYAFPYYAFENAYLGYTIDEVLLFSLLQTLLSLVIAYLKIAVLLLVMIFATRFFAKRQKRRGGELEATIPANRAFDLSIPESAGVMVASFISFIATLIPEIINTVDFILDYAGTYRAGEIAYIGFRYVFILAMLLLSQWTAFLVRELMQKCKKGTTVTE